MKQSILDGNGVHPEVFGQGLPGSGDPVDVQALLHLRRVRQQADEELTG